MRFNDPFDRPGAELRYGLRAGAPLMAGWTLLLLWADRRPVERKDVIAMCCSRWNRRDGAHHAVAEAGWADAERQVEAAAHVLQRDVVG